MHNENLHTNIRNISWKTRIVYSIEWPKHRWK